MRLGKKECYKGAGGGGATPPAIFRTTTMDTEKHKRAKIYEKYGQSTYERVQARAEREVGYDTSMNGVGNYWDTTTTTKDDRGSISTRFVNFFPRHKSTCHFSYNTVA